jgi:putative peptide zinc metalloprotease protein
MLYTDNSEAWKLTSRKARMQIVGAGTAAELTLAVLATLMWSFLQDGPLRSACFIMATLTWVRSLMMNLSPFMRFDGYYMLSDFLDVPNLQDRAFALGRWHLRRLLWGIDAPVPELFDTQKHRILLIYAYATWIYRLVLFTGIAVLVYHTFFKALGIFLFWVEMGWFVIRPIFNEFRSWLSQRGAIQFNMRILFTLSFLTIGILLLIFPWNTRIHAPALLRSGTYSRIYPPFSAQLREVYVKNRQNVRAGDLLFLLESPQIAYKERRAEIKVKTLEKQLERLVGKSDLLEQSQVVQRQLAGALTELDGYRAQKQRMKITAPISGVIMDVTEDIKPGQWIGKEKLLSIVADRDDMVIESYLSEDALKNVGIGDVARFYVENGDDSAIFCSVREIDRTSSKILKEPYLASIYGGDIAVRLENKALVSHQSLYRVILRPMEKMNFPDRVIRGNSVIHGEAQSIVYRFWQQTIAVVVRESGF